MDEQQRRGSQTAREGFANEKDVVRRFNNWKTDKISQAWLMAMDYKLEEIEYVYAETIPGRYKADIQVQVCIKLKHLINCQNLQVKLFHGESGFNQIDRRWPGDSQEEWEIPDDVLRVLKLYTGELKPYKQGRDRRRMYVNEMTHEEQESLLRWLKDKQSLIVCDIIKGRGKFAAEWYLAIKRERCSNRLVDWRLKPINYVLNFYGNGNITVTNRGNISIGRITMQRKGGDHGRPGANQLQFKIDPADLFTVPQQQNSLLLNHGA